MIRLVLASHLPFVRAGIQTLLNQSNISFKILSEVTNTCDLSATVNNIVPDVIILQNDLHGTDCLHCIRCLKESSPRVPIIVFSLEKDAMSAMHVIKAGASGFITRDITAERLEYAIKRVIDGGTFVGEKLAEYLAEVFIRKDDKPLHAMLSDREFDVLRRIASGETLGQISDDLTLSVKTVSTYRSRILQKMGLRNNAQLISYALQQNLVEALV